ncbi:MAG: hypothetical protein LBG44_06545 [Gemmatimonadota bacterium]|jgi:hypothetical protein|nr:hypothetical protein [Gemmatimonadota bacterium]
MSVSDGCRVFPCRVLLFLATLVSISGIGQAAAQTITTYGTARDAAVSAALTVIERDNFLLLDRDTVLGPETAITRDVVIIRARVALEGAINGSVVVVNGEFFTRPGSSVAGPTAVLGGGEAFPSGLSQSGTVLQQDPRVFVSVGRTFTGYALSITPPEPRGVLQLPGVYGFGLPTYERVNGASIYWRPELGVGGLDTATVALRGTLVGRTLRKKIDGLLELSYLPTPRTLISARGGRTTLTPETWIRSDLPNTISSLIKGSDVRDYFESDVASLTIRRLPPPPLIEGEGFIAPGVTFRISKDRSLATRRTWSLMNNLDRENPPIDEGVLASVIGRTDMGWRGRSMGANAQLALEWAPSGPGDSEFLQFSSTASWTTAIFGRHRAGITGYALVPLGNGEVPRQRWSYVGGAGTVPTFAVAEQRGDNVLFGEAVYLIPVTPFRIRVLGVPSIRFEYLAGAAWESGEPVPQPLQNIGAGIQILMLKGMVYVDPSAGAIRGRVSFGAQLSGGLSLPTF